MWTVSGIYFSFNDIEDIRGSQYLKTSEKIEPPKSNKINSEKALSIITNKTHLMPSSITEITKEQSGSE